MKSTSSSFQIILSMIDNWEKFPLVGFGQCSLILLLHRFVRSPNGCSPNREIRLGSGRTRSRRAPRWRTRRRDVPRNCSNLAGAWDSKKIGSIVVTHVFTHSPLDVWSRIYWRRKAKARTVVSRCGPRVERRPLIACSHTLFAPSPFPLPSSSPSTLAPTSVIFLPFCILHFFPAIFFSLSLFLLSFFFFLLLLVHLVHFLRIYYSSSSSGRTNSSSLSSSRAYSSSSSSSLPRVIYFSSLSAYFSFFFLSYLPRFYTSPLSSSSNTSSFLFSSSLSLFIPRASRIFFLFAPRLECTLSLHPLPRLLPEWATIFRKLSLLAPLSLSGRITYNYPKTRLHGAWERLSTLVMPSQSPVHIGPLESGWLEERRLGRRRDVDAHRPRMQDERERGEVGGEGEEGSLIVSSARNRCTRYLSTSGGTRIQDVPRPDRYFRYSRGPWEWFSCH